MKKVLIVNVISLIILFLFTAVIQLQVQKGTYSTLNAFKKENKATVKEKRKVILLLGSSVTQGIGASSPQKSWAGLLNTSLRKKRTDLVLLNLGVSGYTTKDVINSSLRITSNLNAENLTPNVILYETCLINDFLKLNTFQSKQNIETAMQSLQGQFPYAKIYLMPPNDVTVFTNRVNSEGMLYQDYVRNVGSFIQAKGWNYIDFWDEYEKEYTMKGLTLSGTLGEDGKHPNDRGYEIWFQSLTDKIKLNEL